MEKLGFKEVLPIIEGVYDGSVDTLEDCIADAFEKTVKRALSTGKVGKLNVALSFSRVDDTRVEISGKVTTTLPNPVPSSRSVYHDNRGNLSETDPRQQNLPNVTPLKRVENKENVG